MCKSQKCFVVGALFWTQKYCFWKHLVLTGLQTWILHIVCPLSIRTFRIRPTISIYKGIHLFQNIFRKILSGVFLNASITNDTAVNFAALSLPPLMTEICYHKMIHHYVTIRLISKACFSISLVACRTLAYMIWSHQLVCLVKRYCFASCYVKATSLSYTLFHLICLQGSYGRWGKWTCLEEEIIKLKHIRKLKLILNKM